MMKKIQGVFKEFSMSFFKNSRSFQGVFNEFFQKFKESFQS